MKTLLLKFQFEKSFTGQGFHFQKILGERKNPIKAVNGEKYPCDQYKMYQWETGALKNSSICRKLSKSRNLPPNTFSAGLCIRIDPLMQNFALPIPLTIYFYDLKLSALDFALELIL